MAPRTIIVVGGALAGPVAAARAREVDERAKIILLERARDANYSVGGIAQVVSGEARTPLSAQRERLDELRDIWRIDLRTGAEATGIDPRARLVRCGRERLEYSSLIVAGGAESVLPPIPGLEGASNVVHFRTPSDADAIAAASAMGARRAAVIGGGSMGIEAADALARRGFATTLLERTPRLLSAFSPVMSDIAAEGLRSRGIGVLTSARIASAERRGEAVVALALSRNREIACDLVVVAAGVVPRSGLLTKHGAQALPNGALVVDDACRTSLEHVHACGACVALPRFWTEKPAWIPQATLVDRTSQVAGSAAAGGSDRIGEPLLGTTLVRAGATVVGRSGLTRDEAAKACRKGALRIVITESPSVDPFVGDAAPLTVELLHDDESGAIIGGDVGGSSGVDKRLDALAMGLHGVLLTPHALAEVDLGHAPTFSPVRDPLNVAGSVLAQVIAGQVDARLAESIGKARLTLVDVRPEGASSPGAQGARRVPLSSLREALRSLPASRPLAFIDEDGRLGYLACRIARGRGRKDACFISGGLRAWRAAGLPLTAADSPRP